MRRANEIIRARGMTFDLLVGKSGVSRTAICRWLEPDGSPSVFNLDAVLNTLGYRLTIERIEAANE